jgi:hypothetical protein
MLNDVVEGAPELREYFTPLADQVIQLSSIICLSPFFDNTSSGGMNLPDP